MSDFGQKDYVKEHITRVETDAKVGILIKKGKKKVGFENII